MRQMIQALEPPPEVLRQDWAPVRQQALLAIALYWKKAFLEGRQLLIISQIQLPLAAAICVEIQDEKNLGLLATSREAHLAAKGRFSCELPGLLQRAALEADYAALAACAAWTFERPVEGWDICCAEARLVGSKSASYGG
eukprot:symbB.v1.2.040168.t1/scaffold7046.1/size13640/2